MSAGGLNRGRVRLSFQMLTRLVRRLPVMVCPAWTQTLMQPVAQKDVITAIGHVWRSCDIWQNLRLGMPPSFKLPRLNESNRQNHGAEAAIFKRTVLFTGLVSLVG